MLNLDRFIDEITTGKSISDAFNDINPNQSLLDVLEANDPKNTDQIGELCNKLSCVTIQMWHNQEILFEIRRMGTDEFKSRYGNELDKLHQIIKRCCDLNVQRARLMDAIDEVAVKMARP